MAWYVSGILYPFRVDPRHAGFILEVKLDEHGLTPVEVGKDHL